MKLTVSTPVQLMLLAAIVGSAILLLRAESASFPLPEFVKTAAATTQKIDQKFPDRVEKPWLRPLITDSTADNAAAQPVRGLPPLPTTGVVSDAGPMPPLPASMIQPVQPDMVYLGRMLKDGRTKVFFASTDGPVVVEEGDVLNGNWRVDKIATAHVLLRHIQSGETRRIVTGGGGEQHTLGVATVQIGPRFLASPPQKNITTEQQDDG